MDETFGGFTDENSNHYFTLYVHPGQHLQRFPAESDRVGEGASASLHATRTHHQAATPTITPTPTRKPAPTPTPTRGVANAFDFREIAVIGGGGGGGILCISPNEFDPAERQGEFPLIHLNRTVQSLEQHLILVFLRIPAGGLDGSQDIFTG